MSNRTSAFPAETEKAYEYSAPARPRPSLPKRRARRWVAPFLCVFGFASAAARAVCALLARADLTVLRAECGSGPELLTAHASHSYDADNLGAGPSSGSWWRRGASPAAMILVPCSMGTLGAIASGATRNLVHRAADVALKERLPLVLVTRESPLSSIHLRNMLTVSEAGAVIMPFSPGFYLNPQTLDDMLLHMCGRILDQVPLPHTLGRWPG